MLGVLGKSTSADARFTRESLTRGGSQEDPQQLMRDLQDSVERESDLKDQLKFAEEEVSMIPLSEALLNAVSLNYIFQLYLLVLYTKLQGLKMSLSKTLIHIGIQTEEPEDILSFPRSTQTEHMASQVSTLVQTDRSECEQHDEETQTMESSPLTMEAECQTLETSTETYEIYISKCEDAETQTTETPIMMTLGNTDPASISNIFKNIQDRERSPFAATLTPLSTMAAPSSLLFPSMISHALRTGAGAGTANILLLLNSGHSRCCFFFLIRIHN